MDTHREVEGCLKVGGLQRERIKGPNHWIYYVRFCPLFWPSLIFQNLLAMIMNASIIASPPCLISSAGTLYRLEPPYKLKFN